MTERITNKKMFLILGITIIVIGFMGLVLYQMHEQKQAALEQLRILKEKEEATAKKEEGRRLAEQERQKAELITKQRLEEQRKFEAEELERFKAEQDRATREAKRRENLEAERLKEKQRLENLERAKPLKQKIEYWVSQIESIEKSIKEHYEIIKEDDRRFKQFIKTDKVQRAWWNGLEKEHRDREMTHNNDRENHLAFIKGEERKRDDMKDKLNKMQEEYKRLTE